MMGDHTGDACLLGWRQRGIDRGVEVERGEGSGEHMGSQGSKVILMAWGRLPGG